MRLALITLLSTGCSAWQLNFFADENCQTELAGYGASGGWGCTAWNNQYVEVPIVKRIILNTFLRYGDKTIKGYQYYGDGLTLQFFTAQTCSSTLFYQSAYSTGSCAAVGDGSIGGWAIV
jgi:hypothetical protein